MERILRLPDGSGVRLEGHIVPDAWEVHTWATNGVMERSARPVMHWEETGVVDRVLSDDEYRDHLRQLYHGEPVKLARRLAQFEEELEDRRLANLKRSARRAKTQCRRAIIAEGFDQMMTITTREAITDREEFQAVVSMWTRRMRKALGSFRYCMSFEVQERGAFHAHVATHKLPQHALYKGVKIQAWKLGTTIWRDIVGADNGLVFVGAKTRNGGASRRHKLSLAKMAAYVSKYILKDFDKHPPGTNRYQRSIGAPVPKPERMTFYGCTLLDLLNLVYEQGPGAVVHCFKLSRWKDSVWFSAESPPPDLVPLP